MSTRRSHRKSRSGCLQCKQRRIKCDEQGPPCFNCVARKSVCEYKGGADVKHGAKNSHTKIALRAKMPKANTDSPVLDIPSPSATVNTFGPISYHRDTTELELLHTWHRDTYSSFTPAASARYAQNNQAWQIHVVQEAFRHEFLLPAIMSFTALHQSQLRRNSQQTKLAQKYGILALDYQQEASRKFRGAMKVISQENYIAALSFSVLNMGISLATTNVEPGGVASDRISSKSYPVLERMQTVFHMMQGLVQITEIAQPWLAGGPFQSPGSLQQDVKVTYFPDDSTLISFMALLDFAVETDELRNNLSETEIGLERSVKLLRRCFTAPTALSNSICLLWPSFVPATFIKALDDGEPAALIVVMYWGALLHKMDDKKWWTMDAGRNIVEEIQSILSLMNEPRINDLTIWPLGQILGGAEQHMLPIEKCQARNERQEGLIPTSFCMV